MRLCRFWRRSFRFLGWRRRIVPRWVGLILFCGGTMMKRWWKFELWTLLDRNLNSAGFLKRKSDFVENAISRDRLEWIFKRMIELGKTGFLSCFSGFLCINYGNCWYLPIKTLLNSWEPKDLLHLKS